MASRGARGTGAKSLMHSRECRDSAAARLALAAVLHRRRRSLGRSHTRLGRSPRHRSHHRGWCRPLLCVHTQRQTHGAPRARVRWRARAGKARRLDAMKRKMSGRDGSGAGEANLRDEGSATAAMEVCARPRGPQEARHARSRGHCHEAGTKSSLLLRAGVRALGRRRGLAHAARCRVCARRDAGRPVAGRATPGRTTRGG